MLDLTIQKDHISGISPTVNNGKVILLHSDKVILMHSNEVTHLHYEEVISVIIQVSTYCRHLQVGLLIDLSGLSS